jgi:hypothetical protein
MKKIFINLASATLLAGSAIVLAQAPAAPAAPAAPTAPAVAMPKCKDGTVSKVAGRGACSGHGGVAKDGAAEPPAPLPPPPGSTARCKDGSYSQAKSRSGACSGHGGVADWLKKD